MRLSKQWLRDCLRFDDEDLQSRRRDALAEDRNQGVRRYLDQPDSASDATDDGEESSDDSVEETRDEVPLSDSSDSEVEEKAPHPPQPLEAQPMVRFPLLRKHPVTAKDRLRQQLRQEVRLD